MAYDDLDEILKAEGIFIPNDNDKILIDDFTTWIIDHVQESNLYEKFVQDYDSAQRDELYNLFYRHFNCLSSEVLFYWKYFIGVFIKNSRKYNMHYQSIVYNFDSHIVNFYLTCNKGVFKCYIDQDHICYFKQNGTDYYVS